jgi:hypothetical protein
MFIVTATYTRPNIMTSWFQQSDAFAQHFESTYRDTGKVLESTQSISPDGLTFTRTESWATRVDFMAFLEDQEYINLIAARDAHIAQNGIVVNIERKLVGEQLPEPNA